MTTATDDLWTLARGGQGIDAESLAAALELQVQRPPLDFRTTLLIRDGMDGLEMYWGRRRLLDWLNRSPARDRLNEIRRLDLGKPGFPTLGRRIMDAIKPDVVLQFLREIGSHVSQPLRIEVGGAIALILSGNLSRHTDDIDIVDEVPAELRNQHALLDELARRYGLQLTHFQSHFLPRGWERRVKSLGRFGQLEVFVVDTCDVFVGKLFSQRAKDLDDLRVLAPQLNEATIEQRVRESASSLVSDASLAQNARHNWYILFGSLFPE
jgi:hypothetical protein